MNDFKHSQLTQNIIKAYYNVYNTLGFGFLEKVYENAMVLELKEMGFEVEKQKQIDVFYHNEPIGTYYADLLVNDKVILELKAAQYLLEDHEIQLINYLKATKIEVGLLLNFGKKPEFKRKIYSNEIKNKVRSWNEEKSNGDCL